MKEHSVTSYPLDVLRNPALRLRDLPNEGFVQVLRCDDSASLVRGSAGGHSVPALPGIVVPVEKGLWLRNVPGDQPTEAEGEAAQRGILLLEWHRSRENIIPLSAYTHGWPNRLLGNLIGDNTLVQINLPPVRDGMYVVTGFSWSYNGAPDGAVASNVTLVEQIDNSTEILYTRFLRDDVAPSGDLYPPRPWLARPGWGVTLSIPASGTAGVFGQIVLYGGLIFV